MFTGIIREVGKLESKKKAKGAASFVLKISSKKLRTRIGDSIAVNGVCLTVIKKTPNGFYAEVVPETIARTNLGALKKNAPLNLEPSMKAGDRFDGHFVMGHIDFAGRVLETGLAIELPKKYARFIVEKGSVAINGVSLTVAAVKKGKFSVALIPYTLAHTNLEKLKRGETVNVEIDIVARYSR